MALAQDICGLKRDMKKFPSEKGEREGFVKKKVKLIFQK